MASFLIYGHEEANLNVFLSALKMPKLTQFLGKGKIPSFERNVDKQKSHRPIFPTKFLENRVDYSVYIVHGQAFLMYETERTNEECESNEILYTVMDV